MTISAVTDKQILWLAPEGKWVEEGDTLIVYESEKYVISRGEAQSGYLVTRADVTKAMSDLEAQKAKEEGARQNYESLAELGKKGYVMESEVEQARLAYMELKSRTGSFQAAVEAARANLQRARSAVDQQERKLRQGVVRAPRAGLVVYALTGEQDNPKKICVGMTPFEGMDLMYLPDVSSMMVDTEISEVDVAKIKIGLPVEIRLDAYPDVVFKGEVRFIADLAKRKFSRITGKATGAKVFNVTIKVLDRDIRLKPGLTATLDIIVNEYEDAPYLPLEAVFLDAQNRTVVYTKKREKIAIRPVSTVGLLHHMMDYVQYVKGTRKIEALPVVIGESNDRVAVVKEGLEEGQEVLLVRPTSI